MSDNFVNNANMVSIMTATGVKIKERAKVFYGTAVEWNALTVDQKTEYDYWASPETSEGNTVPEGGTAGQVLAKASNDDFDMIWQSLGSYSTSETKTGSTWIDGKPIYEKVLTGTLDTVVSAGSSIVIGTIANMESVIQMYGYCYGLFLPYANTVANGYGYFVNNSGDIKFNTNNTTLSERVYRAIIRYTKTTD